MVDGQPLFKDLIGFLHEDAPPLLVKLREAVGRENAEQVARAAHSLKGLVVNFDAHAAAAVAQKVETMGLTSDLSGAAAEVEVLASRVAELQQHLHDYLAQM
jgi:two-component system sensor histidine kinase/response regulator